MCLSLLFSNVFSNVICCTKRMEILFYSVLFCPPKSIINSFCTLNFLGFCREAKKKVYSLFSSQFYTLSWVLIVVFFNTLGLHLFNFKWTVLKPDLESAVTAHMVYFRFLSLGNITKKRQGIKGGSQAISPEGGGGTAIYGLYRYVPPWRVWFSSSLL